MMKKILLLCFVLMSLMINNIWALELPWSRKPQVLTTQSGRSPEETTPAKSSSLNIITDKKTILRYDFIVKAANNKDSTIECIVTIPKILNAEFVSIAGIQAFENPLTGNEPALTTYEKEENTLFKFFLPQNNNSTGYIEFSVEPHNDLIGKSVQVTFDYRRFKNKLPNIKNILGKYSPPVFNCIYNPSVFDKYDKYQTEKLDDSFASFSLNIKYSLNI